MQANRQTKVQKDRCTNMHTGIQTNRNKDVQT